MSLPSLAMSSYPHHEALLPAAPARKVGKLMDSNDYFLTSIFSSSRGNENNNNQDTAACSSSSSTDEPENSKSILPSPGCSQASTASKLSFDTTASLDTADDSFVLAYSESDPEDSQNEEVPNGGTTARSGPESRSMLTYIPSQTDNSYNACNDVITSVDQIHINLDLVTEVEVEDSSLLYELTANRVDSNQNQVFSNLAVSNEIPNPLDSVKTVVPTTSPAPVSRDGVLPITTSVAATCSPSKISVASSFHRAGVRALSPRIHLMRTTPIRSVTSSPCSSVNGSLSKTPKKLKQTSSSASSSKLSTSASSKCTDGATVDTDSLGCSPILTRTQTSRSKKLDSSMSEAMMVGTSHANTETNVTSETETTSSIVKSIRSRSGKAVQPSAAASKITKDGSSGGTPIGDNHHHHHHHHGDDGDDDGAQFIMECETTSSLGPRGSIGSGATPIKPQLNALTCSSKQGAISRNVGEKAQHKLATTDQQANIHITDEYRQIITATMPNVTAMSVLGDIWSCSRITRSVKRKANELEDLPKQLEPSKQKQASKRLPIESSSQAKRLRVSNTDAVEQGIGNIFELNDSVDELLRYSLVAYHLRRPSSSASYNVAELSRRTLLRSMTHGEKRAGKNDVPSNSTGPVESDGNGHALNALSSQSSGASRRGEGGSSHGRRRSARGTSRGKGKGVVNKPQKRRAGRRSNDSVSSLQNWNCCFCKQGSNVSELGELYGPYNESGAGIELSDKTSDGEDVGEQGINCVRVM